MSRRKTIIAVIMRTIIEGTADMRESPDWIVLYVKLTTGAFCPSRSMSASSSVRQQGRLRRAISAFRQNFVNVSPPALMNGEGATHDTVGELAAGRTAKAPNVESCVNQTRGGVLKGEQRSCPPGSHGTTGGVSRKTCLTHWRTKRCQNPLLAHASRKRWQSLLP